MQRLLLENFIYCDICFCENLPFVVPRLILIPERYDRPAIKYFLFRIPYCANGQRFNQNSRKYSRANGIAWFKTLSSLAAALIQLMNTWHING